MCRKGGRRCPNSTHGRYNKSKASVKSYKVASERLHGQIVKAHTLTNLKAEQERIKSSGDAAKLEAHIAEHGTQQEMSKQLWSAREAVENKTRRMVEHSVRVEGKDAEELEPQYDENDFHIATGIHRRTFAHRDDYMEVGGELYNRHTGHHARRDEKYGEYLSTVDPSTPGDVAENETGDSYTEAELAGFRAAAASRETSEDELRKLAMIQDHDTALAVLQNNNFKKSFDEPEDEEAFKSAWGQLSRNEQRRHGWHATQVMSDRGLVTNPSKRLVEYVETARDELHAELYRFGDGTASDDELRAAIDNNNRDLLRMNKGSDYTSPHLDTDLQREAFAARLAMDPEEYDYPWDAAENLRWHKNADALWGSFQRGRGGDIALIAHNPSAATDEQLRLGLMGVSDYGHEYNPQQKAALKNFADKALAERITASDSPVRVRALWASDETVASSPASANALARHRDKDVRMEFACNPAATEESLRHMATKDRSSRIQHRALQTLRETGKW